MKTSLINNSNEVFYPQKYSGVLVKVMVQYGLSNQLYFQFYWFLLPIKTLIHF